MSTNDTAMSISSCPDEHVLLALAHGEALDESWHAHVELCPACQERLDRLAAELSSIRECAALSETALRANTSNEPDPSAVNPTDAPSCPATFGQYHVVKPLSVNRSGQADVYLGQHPYLHRQVVIKVSHFPCEGDDADRDRLVSEGRILSELKHPNLAEVFDLGFHGRRPFLVIEYVRGRNLQQYSTGRRLPPREAARLLACIARAAATAHRRGILHLDIKPGNVVIDDQDQPRLIDFGMALVRGAWQDDDSAEGVAFGTPAYMAPEQARGEASRLSPAADVFALGAVLYYLLVGRAPFTGNDTLECLERAGRCDFDRQAPRRAGAPRTLARICLRAMAPKPEERYASADDLASALERFASGPRVAAAFAAVAVLAVALILGILLWPRSELPPPRLPEFQPLVHVHRPHGIEKLNAAAPLREGDRVQIVCDVPPGLAVAAFWYGADGTLHEIDSTATQADGLTTVYLPHNAVLPVEGDPGTEFVLVCGRRRKAPTLAEVKALLGNDPLPALPPWIVLYVNSDRVKYEPIEGARSPGARIRDELSSLTRRVDDARNRLRDQFDFVVGVVFRYEPNED